MKPKIISKWPGLVSKVLIHPPYSPDLAPSEYYLFGHLKRFLRGMTFKTDGEVKRQWMDYCPKHTHDFLREFTSYLTFVRSV
ncbi:hypothetical protein LAZ67_13000946 [Cordylochernes scorpioides]|uniref:Histone-lysine N-methyltransferase SETMAR n=1 Tax=Cordylochernes scorpioides TaxID=51811 RepID=A0ABY6L3D5_9ARAC|nr:hypothetical protein LAZ67_13000946 [Cordylochernes scorpioides]